MLKHPPLIETMLTPWDIIEDWNIAAFTSFVKSYRPGQAAQPKMAEILRRLRENGYYTGKVDEKVDERGRLKFFVVTKGVQQQQFEGPELERLKTLPLEELMRIGRGTFRNWMKDDDPFQVEKWQIEEEAFR